MGTLERIWRSIWTYCTRFDRIGEGGLSELTFGTTPLPPPPHPPYLVCPRSSVCVIYLSDGLIGRFNPSEGQPCTPDPSWAGADLAPAALIAPFDRTSRMPRIGLKALSPITQGINTHLGACLGRLELMARG